MEILILFAIAAFAVWAVLLFRIWNGLSYKFLPVCGLAVVLSGCVIGYDFFHLPMGPLPLTIDRVLLVVLLCGFGYQLIQGRERWQRLNVADWVILFNIGMLSISVLLHDWSFKQNLPVSRLLFFYLMPLALYFTMRQVRLGPPELKLIGSCLAGLAVYLAITAFAETRELTSAVFPRYIATPGEFYGRGRGPLLNPVINGMLMVMGCCGLWMGWSGGDRKRKALIAGLTAVIAIGVFCTYTRSVWLGFVASAALFIFYPAPRSTKVAMWVASFVFLVATFPVVGEKLFSFKRDKAVTQTEMELSAKLRPMFVEVAWKMFQDRPLFGCGLGHYSREKYPYLKAADASQPLMATKGYMQHNVFLAYLTETGLVGLLCLLAMLAAMGFQSWRLWRNQNEELITRLFGLLALAMLLNYSINGMFHDVSIIPMANLLLLFLFGIVNNMATIGGLARVGASERTVSSRAAGAASRPALYVPPLAN
jgi:hypothetical protein